MEHGLTNGPDLLNKLRMTSVGAISLMTNGMPKVKKASGRLFIRGPVDWEWITSASKLGGRALHVAIAVAFLDGFAQTGEITLKPSVIQQLGIERTSGYRALMKMEKAGMITVSRRRGAAPIVCIPERFRRSMSFASSSLVE